MTAWGKIIDTINFFEAIIYCINNNKTYDLIKLFIEKNIITQAPYYNSMVDLVDKLIESNFIEWRKEDNVISLPRGEYEIINWPNYLAIKEIDWINCLESKVLNIFNDHFTIYE